MSTGVIATKGQLLPAVDKQKNLRVGRGVDLLTGLRFKSSWCSLVDEIGINRMDLFSVSRERTLILYLVFVRAWFHSSYPLQSS